MAQSYERVQSFAQQVDVSRRAVNEMQEFKDMILREQAQVQELQRLAEERVRREMDGSAKILRKSAAKANCVRNIFGRNKINITAKSSTVPAHSP